MTSLQLKIKKTPRTKRSTVFTRPKSLYRKGIVAGEGSDQAMLDFAKCQQPSCTPIITPAKATLSSKHGQSSAGSG